MGKYLDLAEKAQKSAVYGHSDASRPGDAEEREFQGTGYERNELNEISLPPGCEAAPSIDPSAEGWDGETSRLIDWFSTTTAPAEPFELCQGVTILDPARWWRSIEGDIEPGPNGPRARYGAVQSDLRKLYDLMVGAGGVSK